MWFLLKPVKINYLFEKKIVNSEGETETKVETICIPLSEEKIEVTLPCRDFSLRMLKFTRTNLKKSNRWLKQLQKVRIETLGDIKFISKN